MSARNHAAAQRRLLGTTAVLLVVGVSVFLCKQWVAPRDPGPLEGNWVGISDGDVFIYRLVLNRGGSGVFGFQLADENPDLYRITNWHSEGRKVTFRVASTPYSSELVSIDGSLSGTRIALRVVGDNWNHRVEMWKEDKVLPRILSLREAMLTLHRETNQMTVHLE